MLVLAALCLMTDGMCQGPQLAAGMTHGQLQRSDWLPQHVSDDDAVSDMLTI